MTLLTYIPNVSQDPHFQPDRRPTFRDSFADAPPEMPDELSEAKRYAEHLLTELDEMRNEAAARPLSLEDANAVLAEELHAEDDWTIGENGSTQKYRQKPVTVSRTITATVYWHDGGQEFFIATSMSGAVAMIVAAKALRDKQGAHVTFALPVHPPQWTGRIVAGEGAVAL